MKILAIRGRNLASLCGDFAVDLAAEPLASAGLFAITGPTGAGKSTLLDALCLALFDRTPRLDSRGGARVGRADQEDNQRVPAKDVRGLLTRGQGSGFAEVDFASRDGRRWRARWQVRRARGRAQGRLQPQVLTLEDLDSGDQIGGTKTEVLHAIRERLGLSFDQFRRSALLAQGDFAAFLHAAAKERAELLEKVTGTAIYARLSEAAFVRAKAERETLSGLALQRDSLGLLSAEARQELERDAAAATAALEAAKQALEVTGTAVRWYVERSALRGLEDTGTVDHAAASKCWESARERRETLDLVKAAQPLRARVEQQDTATRRRDEARERVAREGDVLEDAREALAAAEKKLDEARMAQSRAKQEHDTQAPELGKAAVLDDRLVMAQREAEEATRAATLATSRAQAASEESTVAANAVDEERKKRDAADAWLKAHPEAQALSGAWDHLEAALGEHAQAARAAAQAGEALPKLMQAATKAAAAARLATDQAATAEGQLEAAQQAVDRTEAAIPEGRQEQLEAERKICEHRRDAIRAAEETLAAARRIQVEQRRAEKAAEDAHKHQQAALERVEHIGDDLGAHAIRMEEAERALRVAQAVRDLEARRAELTEGEACPLCGATDHPFRHGGVPSHVLTGQQQRVRELKAQGTRLTKEHATAQEQAKTFAAEAEKQAGLAAAALDQLAAPQRSWQRVLATIRELGPNALGPNALVLPEDLLATGVASVVEDAALASQQASDDLHQREQAFSTLGRQAKESRSVRDIARGERDKRVAARERAKEATRQAADARDVVQRRQDEEQERMSKALRSLGTSLAGRSDWRQRLEADGDAFRAACAREMEAFRQQTTAREQASAALAALEPRAARVAAEAKAARDDAAAREESRRKLRAAQETLRAKRQAVLDGRPVAEVKQALDLASGSTDKAFDAALEVEGEKRAGRLAAEAKLEAARAQLRKEGAGLEDAQRVLSESLAEHEIDLETLRKRLVRDPAWCDHEGRELEGIRQIVQAAASVLAERRARRRHHEHTDCPDIPEAEATAQQATAAEKHQQAEVAAQEQQVRRKQDDAARAQGAVLAKEIARQEAQSARWAMLNDAIGSHDGHRFRKFAQGLTLDSLLGYANAHLRDLAPRYHLDRVPGEDLELQVIDRDMGDEVRAINSLSGGETFLASLALALGLSSLSASDTPVESLFIDEGFGTLDLKTLDVALSALDALQASGRQVGVISHVQDLGQRIGAQVRVVQLGAGRSRVETQGGF